MLNKALLAVLSLIILSAGMLTAAETKVEGRIYSSWLLNMTDGADSYNKFALERSYVTAKSKITDYSNVVITMDLREKKSEGYAGYNIILKYGYFDWKPEFASGYLNVVMGLQPTKYLEFVDGTFWGRRYILNSIGDLSKFKSTSDLGLTLHFNLGENAKWGGAGLAVLNGSSYTEVEEKNKQKDYNLYLGLKPFVDNPDWEKSMIAGQFYTGTQNVSLGDTLDASDYSRQIVSLGGKIANTNKFDLGFDLNWHSLGQGIGTSDLSQSGHSLFGTLYLGGFVSTLSPVRTLDLFGRFDMFDPDTDIDDDGNSLYILGVECVPANGIMASLNYRVTDYQAAGVDSDKFLYLNTEFKF